MPPVRDLHEQPVPPHVLRQRHERPELAVVADERAVGSQQVGAGQAGSDRLERVVDLPRESGATPSALAVTSLQGRRRRGTVGEPSPAAEWPMARLTESSSSTNLSAAANADPELEAEAARVQVEPATRGSAGRPDERRRHGGPRAGCAPGSSSGRGATCVNGGAPPPRAGSSSCGSSTSDDEPEEESSPAGGLFEGASREKGL